MKYLCFLLVICVGMGCSSKQNGTVFFNDFESMKGWVPLYLNKEPHHSGNFSNKLDSSSTFGVTFKLRFKDITDRDVKKVKVSFWVLTTGPEATCKLVLQVDDKDKNKVFYLAKNVDELIKAPGHWTKVSFDFTFPNESIKSPDNVISIYNWNVSKKDIYIDDERIEFVI